MAEQVPDRGVDQLVAHEVVVVENQHISLRRVCELVEQRRQHHVHQAGAGAREPRQRLVAERRNDRPQRADQIAPEPDRVVVPRVERDPGKRSRLIRRGTPFAEENRLPPTRRRAQKRQLALAPGHQARDQFPTRDEPRPHLGDMQLRSDEHRPRRRHSRAHRTCLMPTFFRKLGVNTRADAVARGRDLGLL